MKSRLSPVLNINISAFEFWDFVSFTLKVEKDISDMIDWHNGFKTRSEVDEYLSQKRSKNIESRHCNSSDFYFHFNKDSKLALEYLFQEPLNDYKISQLGTRDARRIYEIHSKLSPDTWFMDFLLYI